MTNQVIPEAAVEAASEAFWNDEDGSALESMRLALEAAAPHLMARAWDEGEEFGEDRATYDPIINPYRSQA